MKTPTRDGFNVKCHAEAIVRREGCAQRPSQNTGCSTVIERSQLEISTTSALPQATATSYLFVGLNQRELMWQPGKTSNQCIRLALMRSRSVKDKMTVSRYTGDDVVSS